MNKYAIDEIYLASKVVLCINEYISYDIFTYNVLQLFSSDILAPNLSKLPKT